MDIEKICRRARAEGLSYGQYVYKHRAELAGKRPEPRERRADGRYCKYCGREFIPTNGRQLFCLIRCRVAWHQEQKRKRKQKQNIGGTE